MYDCLGVYVCVCAKVGVRVLAGAIHAFLIRPELHGGILGILGETKDGNFWRSDGMVNLQHPCGRIDEDDHIHQRRFLALQIHSTRNTCSIQVLRLSVQILLDE